ncbi:MAG TPA: hypothetical protein VGJ59_19845 [Jatrophihabitantaceae bacterium]
MEVELAQQRGHRRAFVDGKLLPGKPVPPSLAEQVRHRRGRSQVAGQDRVHLVLDPGALPDQVSAPGHLPTQRPGAFVGQPDRRQEVRSQQLRQDPGIDLVFSELGK